MKFQLAFDTCSKKDFFQILEETAPFVDFIEIGTPAALHFGTPLIEETRRRYPQSVIVADYKICDGGEFEADLAFDSGADIVTVMGFADNETVKGVVRSAAKHQKSCTMDMMGIEEVEARAREALQLGVDYICLHNATDVLNFDAAYEKIKRAAKVVEPGRLAIAGGINVDNIQRLKEFRPEIIIVGSAVMEADDRRQRIIQLKELYNS